MSHKIFHETLSNQVETDFAYEEHKAEQKKYRERIVELERDALSRTVFITNVADLNKNENLRKLELFLAERYGPVQICERATFVGKKGKGSRFPPARVRFQYKRHAEQLFGGKTLLEVRKEQSRPFQVPCPPVGYKNGYILVRPSIQYQGMIHEDITGSRVIEFPSHDLAFGHWFPSGEDAYVNMVGDEETLHSESNLWLEEIRTHLDPILRFDLPRTTVELDFSHCRDSPSVHLGNDSVLHGVFSILDLLGEGLVRTKQMASFRFKDLVYSIELCQTDGEEMYDFVFSLKQPPRLYHITESIIQARDSKTRCTELSGIPQETFGRCFGFRLRVEKSVVTRLLLNTAALEKLQRFGVFRNGFDLVEQPSPLDIIPLTMHQYREVETMLSEMRDWRCGLLLRSVLDSRKCIWYHALDDCVVAENGTTMNIFDLVNHHDPSMVLNVSLGDDVLLKERKLMNSLVTF